MEAEPPGPNAEGGMVGAQREGTIHHAQHDDGWL